MNSNEIGILWNDYLISALVEGPMQYTLDAIMFAADIFRATSQQGH